MTGCSPPFFCSQARQSVIALIWTSEFACKLNPLSLNVAFFQFEYPFTDVNTLLAALGSEKCLQAKQYAESLECEYSSQVYALYHSL